MLLPSRAQRPNARRLRKRTANSPSVEGNSDAGSADDEVFVPNHIEDGVLDNEAFDNSKWRVDVSPSRNSPHYSPHLYAKAVTQQRIVEACSMRKPLEIQGFSEHR